jgi:SAM-dependent methyltransferase
MTDRRHPLAYRTVWDNKPALRAIYRDVYRRILAACRSGPTLEIGGGSGNFKDFAPSVVSSDIIPVPWLDLVCDAQRLPFAAGSFANIVMIEVLHHVENPVLALIEAERVLRPGGRLILCEPAITPISGLVYRLFHDEPVDMAVDPLERRTITPERNPYHSNQAIPTLLVGKYRRACARAIPRLVLLTVDRFSFLAYPLSGGFRPWSGLPAWAASPLLAIEWRLRRLLGRIAAFRLLAVYGKLG